MELNQLRYFQKVARVKSVTRAAQELYISQSTLSQCLMRLEESVGCPLFVHRQGRSLQLNAEGALFLQTVDQVLADLEAGVDQVRAQGCRGGLQVSIASSVRDLCNTIVPEFFRAHPDVKLSQRLIDINALTELLLGDEVDFAVSPCPLWDERLDCRELYTEELMVAVGPDHPFRGRKAVSRDELLGERYVCNYSEADKYFLKMIFKEQPVETIMESNEPSIIQSFIDSGAGIAFIPARVIMRSVQLKGEDPGRFLRVADHVFDVPTCISRKKKRYLTRAAAALYDYFLEYCGAESLRVERFLAEHYT